MDLAVYISELLNEQGAVTLPGLGMFKQVRVAGYYNDAEGKFYPPHFVAAFEGQPQSSDLDLALYISSRNKVSPGSARFFVNKYVADLLQQLDSQEVAVNQLGHLYKQNGEIRFRSNTTGAITSAAYGFSAVNLRPEPQQPAQSTVQPVATPAQAVEPVAPAPQQVVVNIEAPASLRPVAPEVPPAQPVTNTPPVPQPVTPPPVNTPTHSTPVTQPEYNRKPATPEHMVSKTDHQTQLAPEMAEANTSSWNVGRWVVIVLIIVVAAIGGAAIYRNLQTEKEQQKATDQADATIENMPGEVADTVVINKTPIVADTPTVTQPATDSATTTQPQTQAALQPNAQALPPTTAEEASAPRIAADAQHEYALLGGACSTVKTATAIINHYKTAGINAFVLKNPPADKYFKICFGFFANFPDGQSAKLKLVDKYHLERSKLYVEKIRQNPKK